MPQASAPGTRPGQATWTEGDPRRSTVAAPGGRRRWRSPAGRSEVCRAPAPASTGEPCRLLHVGPEGAPVEVRRGDAHGAHAFPVAFEKTGRVADVDAVEEDEGDLPLPDDRLDH